jgi:deoxyribonucleoside regulator
MRTRNTYAARLPSDENRDHLIVQVAKLHYTMQRNQSEIATELGITRWQVAKLLNEALEEGIVRIEITPRAMRRTSLEVDLQKRFGLRDAIVVPMGEITDPALVLETVARAAANYLANQSPKPALLGVGWGRTMTAVAHALPQGWNPGVKVVLVNGATALQTSQARTSAVAETFADSAGGSADFLPVPAIVGLASTRKALVEDPIIRRVLSLAEQAPQVCFGIGGMGNDSVLLRSGYLSEMEFEGLRARGAVGDILGRFVDENGAIVDAALDARTVGLELHQLVGHPSSIGVVAGPEKILVTRAALRAGYLSVLVTDEGTAEFLLGDS